MKRYTLKLRPLTAVHVGTGSTISRLEYTIRSRKEGLKAFLRFQPDKVVEALPEDKLSTFLNLTDGKDFIGLGKFLGENLPQSAVWYLGSCTTGLAGQFTEKATDDMNRLEIEEQYRAQIGRAHV